MFYCFGYVDGPLRSVMGFKDNFEFTVLRFMTEKYRKAKVLVQHCLKLSM